MKDNLNQHKRRRVIWIVLIIALILIIVTSIWIIICWQNIKFRYYASMLGRTGTEWPAVVDDSMEPVKPRKDELARLKLKNMYSENTHHMFFNVLRDPCEHVKVREVALLEIWKDYESRMRYAINNKKIPQGLELIDEFIKVCKDILVDKRCHSRLRVWAADGLWRIVGFRSDIEAVLSQPLPQSRINDHARLMGLFGIYCGILMDEKADPVLRQEIGSDIQFVIGPAWRHGFKESFVNELEHLRPLLRNIVLDSKQEEWIRLKCLNLLKYTSEELIPLYLFVLRDKHFHYSLKDKIYGGLYSIAKKRDVNLDFGSLGIPSGHKWKDTDQTIKWADAIEEAFKKSKKDSIN